MGPVLAWRTPGTERMFPPLVLEDREGPAGGGERWRPKGDAGLRGSAGVRLTEGPWYPGTPVTLPELRAPGLRQGGG